MMTREPNRAKARTADRRLVIESSDTDSLPGHHPILTRAQTSLTGRVAGSPLYTCDGRIFHCSCAWCYARDVTRNVMSNVTRNATRCESALAVRQSRLVQWLRHRRGLI